MLYAAFWMRKGIAHYVNRTFELCKQINWKLSDGMADRKEKGSMTMEEKLREIVARVLELSEEQAEDLDRDTDLMELGLDSMTCVEVVVNLEDEFGITVEEEDLLVENMSTIARLEELVEKYQ